MNLTPHAVLKQYYGYSAFRPLQEEIIQAVLSGKDTLALLPTGGGKSVCYQVPALCMGGLCLVVTPLIALMKDQVMQLRKRNISALAIHSGMAFFEVKKALENAATGQFRFLFVSPERLQTKLFLEYLPAMPVTLLAVDEAHCISQWGYDFRPPYLRIADIRKELDAVPVLALTASATPDVQQDICEKLHMEQPAVFAGSFARPNISFSAFETPHKLNKLLDILQKVSGSALVYCRNRKLTREIATWLQHQGMAASYYHAGLSSEERSLRQETWIHGHTRIMVCTNAFGMGIDKADVRLVVHIGPPDCLEDYYQEAGRGGRDGQKAYAVLLFSKNQLDELEQAVVARFPPLEKIRAVYQAVANYLHLPVGGGEGQYFDFDLSLFCEKYKQEPITTVNALTTLAAEGYLTFSESVFIPSKAGFCCSKDYLQQLERDKPFLEPAIKALLRTYEGIFTNEVNINERTLARLLGLDKQQAVQVLQQLHQYQVLTYTPQKDTPQVFYPYARIAADEVHIPAAAYAARRQRFLSRVRTMIAYAWARSCRSVLMQQYFGEKDAKPCGICDVCLIKKQQPLSSKELEAVIQRASALLLRQTMDIENLRMHLKLTRYQTEQLVAWALKEEIWKYDEQALLSVNAS